MLDLIWPGRKNPSWTLCSAKALREDIVGFKRLFYSARLCTKTNWISVNGKNISLGRLRTA